MSSKEKKLRIIWSQMKTRCYNKNRADYVHYGKRGITVSDNWLNVENFIKDMGKIYKFGLTLDRIDNNKGYSKENCRWATRKEQANNRRTNNWITFEGVTKTLNQWANESNIKISTLYMRLYQYNWPIKKALTLKGGVL